MNKMIKRFIPILLCLSLLTGCVLKEQVPQPQTMQTAKTESETASTESVEQAETAPTEPPTEKSEEPSVKSAEEKASSTPAAAEKSEEPLAEPAEKPAVEQRKENSDELAETPKKESSAPTVQPLHPELEAQVLRLMNDHRAKEGLDPLTMDNSYYVCAEKRARECMDLWSHTRPDGRKSYTVFSDFDKFDGLRMVGENLAKQFKTPEQVVDALMNSPAHRSNIMSEEFQFVAISIIPLENERYAMAQLFMKKGGM